MSKYFAQNSFITTLQNAVSSAITGEIEFPLLTAPTSEFGWLVLEPGTGQEEELYYHRKVGNSVYAYGVNRTNAQVHAAGSDVNLNNTAGIINYLSQNIDNVFYTFQKDDKNIEIFGGEIFSNGANHTIPGVDSITGISLNNGVTNYLYLDTNFTIQVAVVKPTDKYVFAEVTLNGSGYIVSIVRLDVSTMNVVAPDGLPTGGVAGQILRHNGTTYVNSYNNIQEMENVDPLVANKYARVDSTGTKVEFVSSVAADESDVLVDGTLFTGRLDNTVTNLKQVLARIDSLSIPADTVAIAGGAGATGNLAGANVSDVEELFTSIDGLTINAANSSIDASGFISKLDISINTLQALAGKVDQLTYSAGEIILNTATFDKNLTAADTTVQQALNTLDDLVTSSSTINATAFAGVLNNATVTVQLLADAVNALTGSMIPLVATGFTGNLDATVTNVQLLADAVDQLVSTGGTVKTNATDSTADYLENKIQAGVGLEINTIDTAGVKTLVVDKATAITGGDAFSVYSGNITVIPGDATTPSTYQIADISKDYQITFRGDTAANWTASNPTLLENELSIENDTGKMKIGNGINSWNTLPYYTVPTTVSIDATAWAGALSVTDITVQDALDKLNVTANHTTAGYESTAQVDAKDVVVLAAAKAYVDTQCYTTTEVDGLITTALAASELSKVSATDNVPGYLVDKFEDGNGVELVRVNTGADEKLRLNMRVDNGTLEIVGDIARVKGNSIDQTQIKANTDMSALGFNAAKLQGKVVDDLDNTTASLLTSYEIDARVDTSKKTPGATVNNFAQFAFDTTIQDSGFTDSDFVRTGNVNETIGGNKVFSGDVEIQGDVKLTGATANLDVATLQVKDAIIELNKGETAGGISPNGGRAGIRVDRGLLNDAILYFDETLNDWLVTTDNFVTGISITASATGASLLQGNLAGNINLNGFIIQEPDNGATEYATGEIFNSLDVFAAETNGVTDGVLVTGATSILKVEGYVTHTNGTTAPISSFSDAVVFNGTDIVLDTTSYPNYTGNAYVIKVYYTK